MFGKKSSIDLKKEELLDQLLQSLDPVSLDDSHHVRELCEAILNSVAPGVKSPLPEGCSATEALRFILDDICVPTVTEVEIVAPGATSRAEGAHAADIRNKEMEVKVSDVTKEEPETPAMAPEEILHKRTLAEIRRELNKSVPRKKLKYEPFKR